MSTPSPERRPDVATVRRTPNAPDDTKRLCLRIMRPPIAHDRPCKRASRLTASVTAASARDGTRHAAIEICASIGDRLLGAIVETVRQAKCGEILLISIAIRRSEYDQFWPASGSVCKAHPGWEEHQLLPTYPNRINVVSTFD